MSNRFKNTLYTIEDIKNINREFRYVHSDDGTLFGHYRTKIKPEDLPEWYLYGRYYKRLRNMSIKGITDMMYIPSRFSNHYLRDDCLLISCGGKITKANQNARHYGKYEGWDECVWGNEIITIFRGTRKYSGYDIEPFIEKLKWKTEHLQTEFPDPFDPDRWNRIDVDKLFSED